MAQNNYSQCVVWAFKCYQVTFLSFSKRLKLGVDHVFHRRDTESISSINLQFISPYVSTSTKVGKNIKMRKPLCRMFAITSLIFQSYPYGLPQVLNTTEIEEKTMRAFYWDVQVKAFAHITKCITWLNQLP